MDRRTIDGVHMAYCRTGCGSAAIVFIHGNSSCKAAFARQFDSALVDRFTLFAIDLPGHGASEDATEPGTTYTIPAYAKRLRTLLAGEGLHNAMLVGWSLGGHIALEMVAQGYQALGVMITGTPPAGPGVEELSRAFLPYTFESAGASSDASEAEIIDYARNVYGSLVEIPDGLLEATKRTDRCAPATMSEHWASGTSGTSQSKLVANFPMPLAVVHGRKDVFVDPAYLESIPWQNLWRRRIVYFEDCGHAPFLERPDEFNALLEQFAELCLSGSPSND